MSIQIRSIAPEKTHAMRHRILRPFQTLAEMEYPGDREAESLHLGAFDGEMLVGIATIYHEAWPDDPQPGDWRLRGMAVEEAYRGAGVGGRLLGACAVHILANGGSRLWCHARTPARRFYERHGMAALSDSYDAPGIGPHLVMAGEVGEIVRRAQQAAPAPSV